MYRVLPSFFFPRLRLVAQRRRVRTNETSALIGRAPFICFVEALGLIVFAVYSLFSENNNNIKKKPNVFFFYRVWWVCVFFFARQCKDNEAIRRP